MGDQGHIVSALEAVYQDLIRARLIVERHLGDVLWEWDRSKPGVPGAAAAYINGVLYFCVDDIPPAHKLPQKLQYDVYYTWMDKLIHAFYAANLPEHPYYEQALVVICIYSPEPRKWDTDNRSIRAIINALRAIHVIPDDNYQNLAYMVIGQACEKETYTKIFVTHLPDFSQVIPLHAPKVSPQRPVQSMVGEEKGALEASSLEGDFWAY